MWCLELSADELKMESADSFAFESALREELSILKDWRQKISGNIPDVSVHVQFVEPWKIQGSGARTLGTKILMNKRLSPKNLRQIFRHELAHVFLNSLLPDPQSKSELWQETFALYLSGDDFRLRREKQIFANGLSALLYLQNQSLKSTDSESKGYYALARLLASEPTRQELLKTLKLCSQPHKKCPMDLMAILAQEKQSAPKGPIEFLVMDALTGEILQSQGAIDTPTDVGSMLKPVMLHLFPQTLTPQLAKTSIEWACPDLHQTRGHRMVWQEALQLSCNGFFLETKLTPSMRKQWAHYFQTFGIDEKRTHIERTDEPIGLIRKVQLSLEEMASIYRSIDKEHPEVIDALVGTLDRGTLNEQKESPFFLKLQAKLKTGSVRSIQSRPLLGWIGGRVQNMYVFVRASGYSGASLLPELKKIVEPWLGKKLEPVSVQILGLIPTTAIKIDCGKSSVKVGKRLLSTVTVTNLKPLDRVECVRGSLQIHFPRNKNSETRSYWGSVTYLPPDEFSSSEPVRLKQARARRGSAFVLQTTERNYVSRVLAAEMANARQETLKALAFVVRQNLVSHRHNNRPLCDTTHCQVYGPGNNFSYRYLLPYTKAYDAVAFLPIQQKLFLSFAKGGRESWSTERSLDEVHRELGIAVMETDIKKQGEQILINNSPITCEKFRNRLSLLSCPKTIYRKQKTFIFSGIGEGHGAGMDLVKAESLAAAGKSYKELLKSFYTKEDLPEAL